MMITRKACAFISLFIFLVSPGKAIQPNDTIIKNKIYKKSVKTAQIYRKGWKLSYPVMDIRSGNHLELSFDDLADNVTNYQYTIAHCSADWRPSDLVKEDYIDGFTSAEITDYSYSSNTLHHYIHYRVKLPNRDIKPKLTGNYALVVYEDYNSGNVVLTKRFSLYKRQVNIKTDLKRPTMAQYSDNGQELDFSINHTNYSVNDPYNELKVVIRQNNRWDRALVGLTPKFVHGGELVYDFDNKNVFEGGNEFRYFGIQSVRYKSQQIKEIVFADPYYHIELRRDISRKLQGYSFQKDINGKYYIDVQESEREVTRADYVFVHFSLVTDYALPGKEVYIAGDIANWEYNKSNLMEFNRETGAYERILMLKQGYYNYQYVVRNKADNTLNTISMEGSHYQTENDYLIFVYHQNPSGRYDKLIGYKKINSLKRM